MAETALRDWQAPDPGSGARLAMFPDPMGGSDVPDPYHTHGFDGGPP